MAQVSPARSRPNLSRADYERFAPIVRRIAMRLARRVPSTITVNDLIGCGWVGVLEAVRRAGGMPENELEAYASHRIRGAMLDYLRSLDPTTRKARSISRDITRAMVALERALGRPPEELEIATSLSITVEAYRVLLIRVAEAGMARLELADVDSMEIPGSLPPPDEAANKMRLSDRVARAIETLPPRLQQVLALYYQEDCTLREVGQVLGVTESRVSQLHTDAIHRLRAAIGSE